MITKSNQQTLYNITTNLAFLDWYKVNKNHNVYTSKGNRRGYKQYSLSAATLEAREIYAISLKQEYTLEDETQVKAYIHKIRRIKPELMEIFVSLSEQVEILTA